MPCEAFEDLLSAFIDGEAAASEAARAREHLAGCRSCRRHVEILQAMKAASRNDSLPKMPEDLRRTLLTEARRRDAARQRPSLWSWRPLRYGLASALACASLLVVVAVRQSHKDEVPIDVLLAAHNRYAMSMPLAGNEKVLSDLPGKDEADDEF